MSRTVCALVTVVVAKTKLTRQTQVLTWAEEEPAWGSLPGSSTKRRARH